MRTQHYLHRNTTGFSLSISLSVTVSASLPLSCKGAHRVVVYVSYTPSLNSLNCQPKDAGERTSK